MLFPRWPRLAPLIFNLMDLTPEVNALVYGWPADSYEFDSLTLLLAAAFGWPARSDAGRMLADSLNKKARRYAAHSGYDLHRHGRLSRGHGAGGRRGIMPLDQLQIISSMEGKVTAFHVRLRPAPAGEATGRIREARTGGDRSRFARSPSGSGRASAPPTISLWNWPTPWPGAHRPSRFSSAFWASPTPWPCRYSSARARSASCARWAGRDGT